jgi:hypothetical protein
LKDIIEDPPGRRETVEMPFKRAKPPVLLKKRWQTAKKVIITFLAVSTLHLDFKA